MKGFSFYSRLILGEFDCDCPILIWRHIWLITFYLFICLFSGAPSFQMLPIGLFFSWTYQMFLMNLWNVPCGVAGYHLKYKKKKLNFNTPYSVLHRISCTSVPKVCLILRKEEHNWDCEPCLMWAAQAGCWDWVPATISLSLVAILN